MAIWAAADQELLPENGTQQPIVPTTSIAHTAVDAPGLTRLWRYFGRFDIRAETAFWISNAGTAVQMMDTEVEQDAAQIADKWSVQYETEDDGDPVGNPWNDNQLDTVAELNVWLHHTHGIPIRRPTDPRLMPGRAGMGWHSMWGFRDPLNTAGCQHNPWTNARCKTCPGTTRIKQLVNEVLPEVTRRARQEETDMATWFIEIAPQASTPPGRRAGWLCREGTAQLRPMNGAPTLPFGIVGEIVHVREDTGQVLTSTGDDYDLGDWAKGQGLGFRPAGGTLSKAELDRIAAAVRGNATVTLNGTITGRLAP